MFRFLSRKLVHRRNLVSFPEIPFAIRSISTTTTTTTTTTHVDDGGDNSTSFTLSYLINSCGLSQQNAIQASKKLRFQTSTKPDSVLALLRDYGFTNTHIAKFIQKQPKLLVSMVDKNLKPKFEYFISLGFSAPDLVHFLTAGPYILCSSLDKNIIPCIAFFKTILHTDDKIITMLKRSQSILKKKTVVLNIEFLRAQGVPQSSIVVLLVNQPRSLEKSFDGFKRIVEQIVNMNFDPLKPAFIRAVCVWTSLKESTREAKLDVYRKWGWSEEQIRRVVRAQPSCLMTSERTLMHRMGFLVNILGYETPSIVQNPAILQFSLERRIIPRCSVMKILMSNGLLKKEYKISSIFMISNKDFLKKFVTKFEKKVPGLVDEYQGSVNRMVQPSE